MMRFEIICLLVLAAVYANGQKVEPSKIDDARFLIGTSSFSFTTFTILKYTTTISSTFTSVTTCTTSTAALITCTPSMRRRRGLFYNVDNKQDRLRRGLFYDEEEAEEKDGSVFLPAANNKSISAPVKEAPSKPVAGDLVIPLEIQSGVTLPKDFGNSRFLVALGTSTVTSVFVSTSTSSLTAICSSTTGFAICATTGK